MLERLEKVLDLLAAEAALPPGRAVRLEVTHVRPAPDRSKRLPAPERLGGLRSGKAERPRGAVVVSCMKVISAGFGVGST